MSQTSGEALLSREATGSVLRLSKVNRTLISLTIVTEHYLGGGEGLGEVSATPGENNIIG